MRLILILVITLLSLNLTAASLISQSVAEVNSKHLTSRQVILTALISVCIKGSCNKANSVVTNVNSEDFVGQLSKAIFERLAFYESVGVFENYKPISKSQLNRTMSAPIANKLQFNQQEVLRAYKIKMLAKKYIAFKDKNLSVYITRVEAQKYYNKNKASYPSGDLKGNIKAIKKLLQEKRKRLRVEDWVVTMQAKYRVKQFIN